VGIDINSRVISEANYMLKTGKTVREIAQIFRVSKSTVHKDLHERLIKIDKNLYTNVDKILKYHIDIRHLRGGESTRIKYLLNRKEVQDV
jgi:putative DeoR family transcriptional regulator (stage III sporulation protein D)